MVVVFCLFFQSHIFAFAFSSSFPLLSLPSFCRLAQIKTGSTPLSQFFYFISVILINTASPLNNRWRFLFLSFFSTLNASLRSLWEVCREDPEGKIGDASPTGSWRFVGYVCRIKSEQSAKSTVTVLRQRPCDADWWRHSVDNFLQAYYGTSGLDVLFFCYYTTLHSTSQYSQWNTVQYGDVCHVM